MMSVGSLFQIETIDVSIVHCCEILDFLPVEAESLSVKFEKDPCLDISVCVLSTLQVITTTLL